jgi:hypothetical protein
VVIDMTDDERKAIIAEARANVSRLADLTVEQPVEDWLTQDRKWFAERDARWAQERREREAKRAPKIEIIPPNRPASSAKKMVLGVAHEAARVFKQHGAEIERLRNDVSEIKKALRDLKAPQWMTDEIERVFKVADRLESEHRSRLH